MAMGKRPAARQASPMWVDTADLPTSDGHPYFERLNRVLADSGFDAFVEELCAAFYADRLGRPSLRPGRYFRMLFIGYFEGLSSERGIAWRVADSLFIRQLAEASGVETPTRAELARFDRSRKNKKTSNKEWKSPQDPDAKIAKMKDGRTHLAHKAEHGVDMDTGAIVAVTVQDASDGDTATLPETLIMAAEQVEAVQPNGVGVEEVVADKGYHSDATLVARHDRGSESRIGAGARPALLAGQEDGREAAGEGCCTEGSVWEPASCAGAAGSSPATVPGRGGGADFRAHV